MTQNSTAESYLNRLGRLVRVLLGVKFDGAAGIWKLQMDLLDLQRDVQKAIAEVKVQRRRTKEVQGHLDELRNVRWQARRFGDSIAWLLLGLDPQVIHPLANNKRVPIPADDHGARGVMAIATALSNEGWGFPVLHDMTDCLRIGDITFVRPDERPITVEVKTKLVSEQPSEDGRTIFDYQATVIGNADLLLVPKPPPPVRAGEGSRPKTSSRMSRQLRRMSTAEAHQTAKPGLSKIEDQHLITAHIDWPDTSHHKTMRRVARLARRRGYAGETVEDAFFYAAIYDANGLDPERLDGIMQSLPADLVTSGIFFTEQMERNAIVFFTIPTQDGGGPQLWLPYFLYDLPTATILDLVHGRMLLLVIVNPGRVSDALERSGFKVVNKTGRNDLGNDSLTLAIEDEDESGGTLRFELHNLSFHVDQMVMEFQPLKYLVDVARAMREGALRAAPQVFEHVAAQGPRP